MRPAGSGCEDAALEEAQPGAGVRGAIAAGLQHASKSSTPMPSVQHVHVHVEHDAMTNDKTAERRSKLVGKNMVAPHMQRVASLQMRRRVVQLPHGGEPQLVAHERLCHVDVRRHAPMLEC